VQGTAGRVEGGGGVIGVVFHDEVGRGPVQLIEGLHGLPDNLVDRIDGRRREVDGGSAHFVEVLEILGRNRINRGRREVDGGGRRREVDAQFVKGLQIPGRASQLLPPCRIEATAQASASLCTSCSW